jgi:hypothetical protein
MLVTENLNGKNCTVCTGIMYAGGIPHHPATKIAHAASPQTSLINLI